MKPIAVFFLFFICFSISQANAQLTIFGGPQITSAKYLIREAGQATESNQGFMAGVGLKSLMEGPAYFTPMLYLSKKGYKVSFDSPAFPPDSGAVNNNASMYAIELAPLVQFNFSKKASYLFLRFGPSFDFNISGKEQFDSSNGKHVERDMTFSFGDYSYATIALNLHVGFQHKKGLSIFGFYNYGVSSLNNADLGPQIYHRIAGVAVGWTFGKKE